MLKAIFADFYGTIVYEDGPIIKVICERIQQTGKVENISDIDSYWRTEFQQLFINSYWGSFRTQRVLEYESLVKTVEHFKSTENPHELSNYMFEYWSKPPIFEDGKEFIEKSPVPVYIISNIDNCDIESAIKLHGLAPTGVYTSENAKSYKPRREIFEMALGEIGLQSNEVIHIGDSINSDIKGAEALGIQAVWLNRFRKSNPNNYTNVKGLIEVFSMFDFSKVLV